MNRRSFIGGLGAAAVSLPMARYASAQGATGKPGSQIKIGFIATTDLGPVVMADRLGYYKKNGLDVLVTKEASWGVVRDKLLSGELDAAMCHFGIPFGVISGVSGPAGREIKITMMLNTNGQGLTLRRSVARIAEYGNMARVPAAIDAIRQQTSARPPTFAMAFPGVSHDLCLRSWLAAAKVDPKSVSLVTIPPAQMLANLRSGDIDGFYVGEPWHAFAAKENVGFTHFASQDVWLDHPEKCLASSANFANNRRDELKQVTKSVLEAAMWCDDPKNAPEMAKIFSGPAYLNVPADAIADRLEGRYNLGGGLGEKYFPEDRRMRFYQNGRVNYPRTGHGIWFLAQYERFGLAKAPIDYKAMPGKILMQDLYKEVAAELKVPLPTDDMKPFALQIDQIKFDPNDPQGSLKRYVA